METNESRRPLKSRGTIWAKTASTWLKNRGARPNQISVASLAFAALAAFCLCKSGRDPAIEWSCRLLLLAGALAGIGGRLLCNLFDGMVAVEGGMKSPVGELYNDIPDRLSDIVIFLGLGSAATIGTSDPHCWYTAGWAMALLAVLSAYIRYVGASCGLPHFFLGPMAKQHRMAATIAATVASAALEPNVLAYGTCYRFMIPVILLGTVISCLRRIAKIGRLLNQRGL